MISKSKSMAVAAAALAMCMAGSAFAQDRPDRGPGRDNDRYEQQHRRADRDNDGHRDGRGNNGYRDDNGRRHDGYRGHSGYRGHQDFRDGRHFDRSGYPHPRSEWRRGGHVPSEYRGRNYVVSDWRSHRLQAPPRGYHWVGVGGDYVLAAVATGVIMQIIAGQ
jgi:Ni/Co efflux regulator RcnB